MSFQKITYVKMTDAQKKSALEILGAGTVLLKKWSVFFPSKKYRQFRNAVMEGSLNPEFDGKPMIPQDQLAEFQKDLPTMRAIRQSVPQLDNRSAEETILQGCAALAQRHVNYWALRANAQGLSDEDMLQEAYMQVIEAMYSWVPEHNVDIVTFVWSSMNNRFSNVVNQASPFCPLTNSDLQLVAKYHKTKKKMVQFATFDDILSELGLSNDEGKYLTSLLTYVFPESTIDLTGNEKNLDASLNDASNDYTVFRQGIDHEPSSLREVDGADYVSVVLKDSGLSQIERELIEAAMEPYSGWQTQFAKDHINPATGKSYSRMRITQMLSEVRQKVATQIAKAA